MELLIRGHGTVRGQLHVDGDVVRVIDDQQRQQQFERARVVSISGGAKREVDNWSAKLSLGANFRAGNTEQVDYNGRAIARRTTARNRVNLDYIGNYSIISDVEQANNHRATANWDRFITERLYVSLLFGEYFRDPFSNIRDRATLGAGVGYQIKDTARTDWQASAGPAFQRTRSFDVTPGEPESESTPALVAGTKLGLELTKSIDLDYEYRFQITNKKSGSYNHHMLITFEFELTKRLDFEVSLVWDRIKNPRPDSEGNVPRSDDYRLEVGLGWDF
jgi:putative salt-induced outer membrane protein YdiY